ncbi:MAG: hypothetical protein KJ064_21825 [Anaerolineae bacterium]|nr:hypothetical protein [Anaerolineae bacterium]
METINILLALLIFGVFHSIMATIGFKAMMLSLMGERAYLGLYRFLYNIVSVVTFAPVLLWAAVEPGENLWSLDGGMALLFLGVQLAGLLGLLISLLQIDGMRFIGLKQLAAYLNGDKLPLPPEPLILNGVYRLVRHPLYLFSLMFIWFLPTMSAAAFGLALGATLYFVLGSLLEEQRLVREFGKPYLDYQQEVPWMIPFVRLPRKYPAEP